MRIKLYIHLDDIEGVIYEIQELGLPQNIRPVQIGPSGELILYTLCGVRVYADGCWAILEEVQ